MQKIRAGDLPLAIKMRVGAFYEVMLAKDLWECGRDAQALRVPCGHKGGLVLNLPGVKTPGYSWRTALQFSFCWRWRSICPRAKSGVLCLGVFGTDDTSTIGPHSMG